MSLARLFLLAGLAWVAAAAGVRSGATACPSPSFDGSRDVVEAPSMDESTDPCWWLSSGALVSIEDGTARTIQGELSPDSEWRSRYAQANPVDTDDGAHPQNLLRLVTRASWRDARQEVRFRITRIHRSRSTERGEWNGVLLFMRYVDSGTLYYAGLRTDGTAVIKRKRAGRYATLAQQSVYNSQQPYDRDSHPTLLPTGRWIGLAGTIRTQADGSVRIAVFTRDGGQDWRLAVEAVDQGADGSPILQAGHGGLRADFMDLEFADYRLAPDAGSTVGP